MSFALPLPSDADPMLDRLVAILRGMGSVLVCYSGGVDSAFVLAVAHRALGENCIGMTAVSPSLADFEREEAVALAKQIGGRHELVESNEIDNDDYAKNGAMAFPHWMDQRARLKQSLWHPDDTTVARPMQAILQAG